MEKNGVGRHQAVYIFVVGEVGTRRVEYIGTLQEFYSQVQDNQGAGNQKANLKFFFYLHRYVRVRGEE